jgi:hypothetical protein
MTIRLFVIWELLCGVYAVVELKDATLHLLSDRKSTIKDAV